MEKNNLYIVWHLGMGDVIICSPIVRQLAPLYELVVIPVKHWNVPSANYLFRDLPNVAIRGVNDDDEMEMFARDVWKTRDEKGEVKPGKILRLGGTGNNFVGSSWDRSFYRQADLPFDTRWTQWKCARDLEAETKVAERFLPRPPGYAMFFHEDHSRGMVFDEDRLPQDCGWRRSYSISPDPSVSPILFHWRTVIESCDEIHCISSSFAAFIDSIPLPKNPKLFLHKYCRPGEPICEYRHPWRILE